MNQKDKIAFLCEYAGLEMVQYDVNHWLLQDKDAIAIDGNFYDSSELPNIYHYKNMFLAFYIVGKIDEKLNKLFVHPVYRYWVDEEWIQWGYIKDDLLKYFDRPYAAVELWLDGIVKFLMELK